MFTAFIVTMLLVALVGVPTCVLLILFDPFAPAGTDESDFDGDGWVDGI